MIQEHLRQKALLPENYESAAQKLLKTVEIVKMTQKEISGMKQARKTQKDLDGGKMLCGIWLGKQSTPS